MGRGVLFGDDTEDCVNKTRKPYIYLSVYIWPKETNYNTKTVNT